jgi:hypothetical protein
VSLYRFMGGNRVRRLLVPRVDGFDHAALGWPAERHEPDLGDPTVRLCRVPHW